MTNQVKIKTLLINNRTLPFGYVPNTMKYKLGIGETNVRAAVNGNVTNTIHSQNAEMRISEFTVETYPYDAPDSTDMRRFILELSENSGNNVIVITAADGSTVSFTSASLTNDPEINDSFDGTISMEFKGNPASVS